MRVDDLDEATFDHHELAYLLRGQHRPQPKPPRHLTQRARADPSSVSALAGRLKHSTRAIDAGLIHRHRASGPNWGDPDADLAARGDIQAFAPGVFRCTGPFLAVIRGFDRVLRALGAHYGAAEHDLPPLGPDDLPALLEPAPGPSSGCHFALGAQGIVANTLFHAGGKVVRRVAGRPAGIAGARVCTRRELLAVGTSGFVEAAREEWLDDMVALIEHLDMEARVLRSGEGAGAWTLRGAFQKGFGLHYAVCAAGPSAKSGPIPVMGLTLHLDRYARAFGYRLEGGRHAHSGTLGVDLEPLAYALMVRHGPRTEDWPDDIQSLLGLL